MKTDVKFGQVSQELRFPLYYQIKRELREKIGAGELPEGSLLPTEAELQRHFGVSRTTVRQALSELAAEGLITRHPGKGTIVGRKIADQRPRRLVGFIEELRARGVEVALDVREVATVPAAARVARRLAIPVGTPVTRIIHRSATDAGPIGMSRIYLSCADSVTPEEIAQHGGLFTFLRAHCEERHGRRFTHALRTTGATLATPEEAQVMDIAPSAAIVIVNLVIHAGDTPAVYIQALYRADRYEYQEVLEV